MGLKFSNNAASTLAGSIASGATTISIQTADAGEFPSLGVGDYFMATIVDAAGNREIVKVTDRASAVLTVVRAQEGTTARAFAAGDSISNRLTAGSIASIMADITALQASLGALATLDEVDTAQITIDAVTDQRLRNSAGLSVIGRAASGTGDPGDIISGADGQVLKRNPGATLGWGHIDTVNVNDGAITSAKIADGTIQTGDLADNSISANKIGNGEVTPAKIQGGTMDAATAQAGSSGTAQLITAAVLKNAILYHTAPYTGTFTTETAYPVGHHVIVSDYQTVSLNTTLTLYAGAGYGPTVGAAGSFLAGTWRMRGSVSGGGGLGAALFQRVA